MLIQCRQYIDELAVIVVDFVNRCIFKTEHLAYLRECLAIRTVHQHTQQHGCRQWRENNILALLIGCGLCQQVEAEIIAMLRQLLLCRRELQCFGLLYAVARLARNHYRQAENRYEGEYSTPEDVSHIKSHFLKITTKITPNLILYPVYNEIMC